MQLLIGYEKTRKQKLYKLADQQPPSFNRIVNQYVIHIPFPIKFRSAKETIYSESTHRLTIQGTIHIHTESQI